MTSAPKRVLIIVENLPVLLDRRVWLQAGTLHDPEQCQKMGALGRRRAIQMLSWDHERPKLLACCERLFRHARRV